MGMWKAGRSDCSVENGGSEGDIEVIIACVFDGGLANALNADIEITARRPGRINRPGIGPSSAASPPQFYHPYKNFLKKVIGILEYPR